MSLFGPKENRSATPPPLDLQQPREVSTATFALG